MRVLSARSAAIDRNRLRQPLQHSGDHRAGSGSGEAERGGECLRGLPGFMEVLPVAMLAEEMRWPGPAYRCPRGWC